jgi:hypothetical protein
MNTFIDIIFLFVYLFTMFFFGIPDVANDNYIGHKIILFVSLFIYNFALNFIKSIFSKNNNNIDIFNDSFQIAVAGIIGYSLFIDLTIMDSTYEFMNSICSSENMLYLTITIVMILFISLVKIFKLLFMTQ